jgi:hypothetical protein
VSDIDTQAVDWPESAWLGTAD